MLTNKVSFNTPIGTISLFANNGVLVNVVLPNVNNNLNTVFSTIENTHKTQNNCAVLTLAQRQINEYFTAKRKVFDIDLKLEGTPFQKKIWHMLKKLPFGETISYKELALKAGNKNAARAVGLACNKNPFPLLIPCHRVIGSSGALTGYAGGIETKRYLLDFELQNII